MVFIVEMFGGYGGTETYRKFFLHGGVWPQLRQIAVAHGWKPLGTCLLPACVRENSILPSAPDPR
jgi:hypothetical protein